ncbi:MAG: DNA-processing protein DprA [Acidobacteriaceae bacterium]|jgi:DNA processing protein|nr:DNA-processing protein DprA [Acidobacteriaceae bacterium]
MTPLHELVALSLLPVSRLRTIVQQFKSGFTASDLLSLHCADRQRRHPKADNADRVRARAHAALERGMRAGLVAVRWDEAEYPAPLLLTIDPPLVLWVRGSVAALQRPSVAIVGARTGSPYALAVAERLAGELAVCGVVVVSGLARGVDAAAHRGAVNAPQGVTVAVLGSGADVLYPREHGDLAARIVEEGAIVSELAPGTPPCAPFFPQRNRIISGLSRAVVVIEAGEKSGSLITARCALEQGREVLAVPGNVLNGRNKGGHALLRDGARLVESAADIIEELGFEPDPAAAGFSRNTACLPPVDDPLLAVLPSGEACDLDRISGLSGLPMPRLLARLLELEMEGQVRRLQGGQFVRVDRSC